MSSIRRELSVNYKNYIRSFVLMRRGRGKCGAHARPTMLCIPLVYFSSSTITVTVMYVAVREWLVVVVIVLLEFYYTQHTSVGRYDSQTVLLSECACTSAQETLPVGMMMS